METTAVQQKSGQGKRLLQTETAARQCISLTLLHSPSRSVHVRASVSLLLLLSAVRLHCESIVLND